MVVEQRQKIVHERVTQSILQNDTQTLKQHTHPHTLTLTPSHPHLDHGDPDIVGAGVVGQFSDHLVE